MDPQNIYLGPRGGGFASFANIYDPTHHAAATKGGSSLDTHSTPSTPTEITDFDSWLRAYQELVLAEKDVGLESENLRIIFNNEASTLNDLFRPVQCHIDEKLKEDTHQRGLKLYGEWGRTMRKEFLLSYYDNEYFRAQYARNRFLNSARTFMQAVALRLIPQCTAMETYLASIKRVISIGVGPGSDIAGFLAFIRTRGMNQRLTYFVIDQCPHWSEYAQICDRNWAAKYNVSLWFKCARIGHIDSLNLLPEADMIVFSFSNTSLMEPSIWPILRQRYRLIIVLDGIKEILIEGFSDCCFEKIQLNEKTNLYYTFQLCETSASTIESKAETFNSSSAL